MRGCCWVGGAVRVVDEVLWMKWTAVISCRYSMVSRKLRTRCLSTVEALSS